MEFSKEEFENASTIFKTHDVMHLTRDKCITGKIFKGQLSVG